MDEFAMPQVLDPDRLMSDDRGEFTADHEALSVALNDALHDTCAYAQRLWSELDAVRGYLLTSAPENPRLVPGECRDAARPTGVDDEQGWAQWSEAYASVTSLLAGPGGDSGYGEQEARREQRDRRLTHTTAQDEAGDHAPEAGHAPESLSERPSSGPTPTASGPEPPSDRARAVPAVAAVLTAFVAGRWVGRRGARRPSSARITA